MDSCNVKQSILDGAEAVRFTVCSQVTVPIFYCVVALAVSLRTIVWRLKSVLSCAAVIVQRPSVCPGCVCVFVFPCGSQSVAMQHSKSLSFSLYTHTAPLLCICGGTILAQGKADLH